MSHHLCPTTPLMSTMVKAIGSSIRISRVTAESVQGVVGGHDVVCGVIHPSQMWTMLHITLMNGCI